MTFNDDQIDALILDTVTGDFTKIALIISRVYDKFAARDATPPKDLSHIIAERIYILVDHGRLDVQGNMRRWRDAAIKRAANPPAAVNN